MNGKRFSEDKARKNGFYLALAVCLVAVGIAAWSTYDAVHGYLVPASASQTDTSSQVKQQENEVLSGQETGSKAEIPGDDDPEAPRTTPSAPAKETGGSVTIKNPQKTESSAVSSMPAESKAEVPVTAPLYEISTQMIYPVQSKEAVKAYSAGAPIYSETMKDWRIHAGTDLKAENEEKILACGNGEVKETYTDGMLGNVVVVEHGDYTFYYCGLGENFLVKQGDIVTMGQEIGTVTAVPSESAEAAHVHLEVKRDGAYLDPQKVIEGTD